MTGNLARRSARRIASFWRDKGVAMPQGSAERFGRVVAEFLASRKDPLSDGLFELSMGRLSEIVDAAEKAVPRGKDDPAFLDVFAAKLREEFESYEREDPGASA